MKSECRTAVEGVLGRKLSDKEADLLEQQFIKASRELPAEDIKAWKSTSDEERAEAIGRFEQILRQKIGPAFNCRLVEGFAEPYQLQGQGALLIDALLVLHVVEVCC